MSDRELFSSSSLPIIHLVAVATLAISHIINSIVLCSNECAGVGRNLGFYGRNFVVTAERFETENFSEPRIVKEIHFVLALGKRYQFIKHRIGLQPLFRVHEIIRKS